MVFLNDQFFIYANLELPFYFKKNVIFGRTLHKGGYFWWVDNSPVGENRLTKIQCLLGCFVTSSYRYQYRSRYPSITEDVGKATENGLFVKIPALSS